LPVESFLLTLLLILHAGVAMGQSFPARPVRLVVVSHREEASTSMPGSSPPS